MEISGGYSVAAALCWEPTLSSLFCCEERLHLNQYNPRFPSIANMSESLDKEAAEKERVEQNRLTLMSLSSGEEARRARGKKEIQLPSETIANSPTIEQVLSSGKEAQKRRQDKKG